MFEKLKSSKKLKTSKELKPLKKLKPLIEFADKCLKDQLTLYAAQSSFFMMFSLFPIIMIVISIIQMILPLRESDFLNLITSYIPSDITFDFSGIFDNLLSKSAGTIISLSTITVLWSASKVVYALVIGLNNIHHATETRNSIIRRLLSILYTLVFILIIIFYFIILVFGDYIQLYLEKAIPALLNISVLIVCIRTALSICVLVLFFALMYMALPDKKLNFKKQLPGAIFTTAGWLIFSFIFNIYINNFSNYSYIYGSITAIVLFMLWMYCCMVILLAGAELNILIEEYRN